MIPMWQQSLSSFIPASISCYIKRMGFNNVYCRFSFLVDIFWQFRENLNIIPIFSFILGSPGSICLLRESITIASSTLLTMPQQSQHSTNLRPGYQVADLELISQNLCSILLYLVLFEDMLVQCCRCSVISPIRIKIVTP